MDKIELNRRFFNWTNDILDMVKNLSLSETNRVIVHQLIKSCTSSGANYRAACRAKSINDMINKLKIVEEETDESLYWLELLKHRNQKLYLDLLIDESNQLLSIIIASIKTLRKKQKSKIENQKS